jgi:O-antigen/teichoic acid export membrane protein
MAFFSAMSQAFTWVVTIVIARILVPGDYGLQAMATIITGYALSMSQLGLGGAVVQRLHVDDDELSSVFWFMNGVTLLLGICCFPIAYLTAALMHEPRVIPLTQTISIVFVLNGLQILPAALLRREMDFKTLGLTEMVSAIVASAFMLVIAKSGGGVWTLVLGSIVRSGVRTIQLFARTRWRPRLHFKLSEALTFLSFGIALSLGQSLFYLQEKSDRFFAGRVWQPGALGIYTFALELAQIPTDKIVTLINNVSFPAFAKLQNDAAGAARLYLHISKVTAAVNLPLFMGGFILGDDLVRLVLNPDWYPMVFVFRMACLAQILTSLNAINNFVHAAQGRPRWSLYYHIASCVLMPASFAIAAPFGLNAMAIPWVSTYAVLCVGWIFISLRKLDITVWNYVKAIWVPLAATAFMSLVVAGVSQGLLRHPSIGHGIVTVAGSCLAGVVAYAGYFWFFDRGYLVSLRSLATASIR